MPRYFVYDHVSPQTIGGKLYYPAVKNHMIFQSIKYKTHGMISQDLSDFKSGDEYFTQFRIKPLATYPSATGLTRFTNELLLIGLFFIWWLLINKLHNASIATNLYREAKASPSLERLSSYLNASSSLRFIQPIKRRKSKKQATKLRLIYRIYLNAVLEKCAVNADVTAKPTLTFISNELKRFKQTNPRINVQTKLIDITPAQNKQRFEENAVYGQDYFVPTQSDLGNQIAEALAETLNKFLPEPFIEPKHDPQAIHLETNVEYSITGQVTTPAGETATAISTRSSTSNADRNNIILYKNVHPLKQPKVTKGERKKSQDVASVEFAQFLSNQLILNSETVNESAKIEKSQYEAKIADMKRQKTDLFDSIIKECKSAGTEAAVLVAVGVAMDKNPELVDKAMVNVYEFLSANSELITAIVTDEAIAAGFAEAAAGGIDV